jgi:hypothetical protein
MKASYCIVFLSIVIFSGILNAANDTESDSSNTIDTPDEAVEIIYDIVNGHGFDSKRYQNITVGEATFLSIDSLHPGVLVRDSQIYVMSYFESGGEAWIEEYSSRIEHLDENSIRIWPVYYDFDTSATVNTSYIEISLKKGFGLLAFNCDGMVTVSEAPSSIMINVKGMKNCIIVCKALSFLVEYYKSPVSGE